MIEHTSHTIISTDNEIWCPPCTAQRDFMKRERIKLHSRPHSEPHPLLGDRRGLKQANKMQASDTDHPWNHGGCPYEQPWLDTRGSHPWMQTKTRHAWMKGLKWWPRVECKALVAQLVGRDEIKKWSVGAQHILQSEYTNLEMSNTFSTVVSNTYSKRATRNR